MTDHDTDTDTDRTDDLVEPDGIRWKTSPIDRGGAGLMVATFVVMTAILTAVGFAVVEFWEGSSAGEADADLNRWLEDRRTPAWTGSWMSSAATRKATPRGAARRPASSTTPRPSPTPR